MMGRAHGQESTAGEVKEQEDFCYAFGRIKALETRLIPKARMEELARSRSVHEVLAHLEETEYTHYLPQSGAIVEFEQQLEGSIERAFALCESMTPERWVVGIFRLRREFEGFKESARKKGKLPDDIAGLIAEKNSFESDVALDREMFSRMLSIAKDDDVKKIIREEIDLQNLLALGRAKESGDELVFIEGGLFPKEGLEAEYPFLGKAGSRTEAERICRQFLLSEAKRAADEKMATAAVVYAFLLEKENEVHLLSAVIKSKILGLEGVFA